jgi:hypothetical protein
VATEHEETENHPAEESENGPAIKSKKGLALEILPWLMAALAAGLFFSPPGTATSIKIVTLIIMVAVVVAAAIKVRRALRLSGKRSVSILALLAVPAALLGTALGWQLGRHLDFESTAKRQSTVTVSILLQFTDKPYITVPYCRSYYGTGIIPKGDSLLIFDSPADDNWDLKQPVRYTFHGSASPQQNGGWVINNVDILGPSNTGAHAVLFGVLEKNQDAQFIQQIAIYSKTSGSYWRSGTLPLGLEHINPLQIVVSDATNC